VAPKPLEPKPSAGPALPAPDNRHADPVAPGAGPIAAGPNPAPTAAGPAGAGPANGTGPATGPTAVGPAADPAAAAAAPGGGAPAKPATGPTGGTPAKPATGPAGAAPAKPASAPNLAGPAPCSDQNLALVSQVAERSYKVGQRPLFRLVIANISDKPCTRDLDPALRGLVVSGPRGQLWADNDCNPEHRPDVRVLEPGKPLVFTVNWAGRTSRPGCGGVRQSVGPGNYQLVGKLGPLTSGPAVFNLTQ
jgi:hypothetical protein